MMPAFLVLLPEETTVWVENDDLDRWFEWLEKGRFAEGWDILIAQAWQEYNTLF